MGNPPIASDNTAKTEDLMGYEVAKAPETTPNGDSIALSTQDIINNAVKEVTVDENGKYQYPADMDPMLKAAVAATKSSRDNQAEFTKSRQSLKGSEAEIAILREKLIATTQQPLELTPERQQELDDLMYTDPQEWRKEINKLEKQSSIAQTEVLDTVSKEARQKASAEDELQERISYLESFNGDREVPITVDILDNDVPKRINDKLANGEVTFSEYIDAVSTYLETGKVVAQADPNTSVDLNKSSGSSSAPESAQLKQQAVDYSQMTF